MKGSRKLGRLAFLVFAICLMGHAPFARAQLPRTHIAYTSGPTNGVTFDVHLFSDSPTNSSVRAGKFTTVVTTQYTADSPPNQAADVTNTPVGSYGSYCVDIFNNIGTAQATNLSFRNGIVDNLITGNILDRNIGAAAWLFQNEAHLFSTVANPNNLNVSQKQAAMQLAIWELTFDSINDTGSATDFAGLSYNLYSTTQNGYSPGDFYIRNLSPTSNSTKGKIVRYAQRLLDAAAIKVNGVAVDYQRAVGVLVNFHPPTIGGAYRSRQDQIIRALVPEPASIAMAVSALGLLAVTRRLRRSRAS